MSHEEVVQIAQHCMAKAQARVISQQAELEEGLDALQASGQGKGAGCHFVGERGWQHLMQQCWGEGHAENQNDWELHKILQMHA